MTDWQREQRDKTEIDQLKTRIIFLERQLANRETHILQLLRERKTNTERNKLKATGDAHRDRLVRERLGLRV